ncbi:MULTISPECIES: hypothetical protein [Enterococcus]|jgi:hypothetical protein|uniref:hypothetical protein n=1 Tax=Enterococcus TaxID=1350 RepID=UPI00039B359B|nr:hypothetical protein [Enterococcus dispar]MCU7357704.1 hypothetical protein [Enterococcus dispar]MDT2706289.1 hypothetical protein [Enterococcus dispar]OJG39726.1 hypothetical protein RV01_GL000908 [Enterococcus dispar]WCG34185.1 hypothetical protein PML78_05740 [Enterococcus dispar]
MLFLLIFTLIAGGAGYLFYLLTKDTIREVYEQLDDKNEKVRKIKAVCLGVFHLIAF